MQANINIEARATIIALHKSGHNKTQISVKTGLTRNTVSRWIKRYEEEGSCASRPRSGRPSLISEAQRKNMVGEYETNGFTPIKHFAKVFDASVQTVRRALRAEGLRHRRGANKPFLTEKNKQDRLRFARDYLDFDWNTTIFSDEKTLKSSQKGRLHLVHKDNTRLCDNNVIPNTELGQNTVNMWGWMSAAGPGELAFIPPHTNSSTYVEVLDNVMLPTVRIVYPATEMTQITFVQDNCPIHRASTVRDWFHNHPEIIVVPWPARSPDLNPIENLWGLMAKRWESRSERDIEQLETSCMEVWEYLRGTDICSNIVLSMRKRLLDCIENIGDYTNINI